MERTKLKLAVIILLAVLNLCLLGVVVSQNRQTQRYEELGREQALLYLENRGISVQEETVPWESRLQETNKPSQDQLLDQEVSPQAGVTWEVQSMRQAETLLVDFAVGLEDLGASCSEIRSITEGYTCASDETRAVFTPVWQIETDSGTYCLDCAAGALTLAGTA